MPNYRRCRIPGGLYFFTVVTSRRQPLLIDHIDALRGAFRLVRRRHPFHLPAAVILPDHLHCIWELPRGDVEYSRRWRLIKSCFSRALDVRLAGRLRSRRGERDVWQRRFWEHAIRDENDFARHVEYIHFNPVKHGYVKRACDWPYSSFRRYVENGIYEESWADGGDIAGLEFE
jgi:putative transposase